MTSLGARMGFWLILILIGTASGGYLMWGQVQDARSRAESAEARAEMLGKSFEELTERQALTDANLARRRLHSDALNAQLSRLRSDLNKVIRDDPKSSEWAAGCVPGPIADRMRLPADPSCNDPGITTR